MVHPPPGSLITVRLFVLGNASRPGVLEAALELRPWLESVAEVVVFDLEQKADLSNFEADLTLVLGGDGAILRAARQMGYRQMPVLGVNLGRLGFLADLSVSALRTALPGVMRGEFRTTRHVMLECIAPGQNQPLLFLNDITITNGPPFHMLGIDLMVGAETASRYSCDGLIVSTPVGSTAHSLSAGGPILGQEIEALVITPICPHGLGSRPLVDSAANVYRLRLFHGAQGATVVIDGQQTLPLQLGQEIVVRRAPVDFQLIKVPGQGFYQTLREKLNWGTTPNYRPEGISQ